MGSVGSGQPKGWQKFVESQKMAFETELVRVRAEYQKAVEQGCPDLEHGDHIDEVTHLQMVSERNGRCARLSGRIAELEAALVRIKRGTYGLCAVCGSHIPMERLQALPFAQTHIEAARGERCPNMGGADE